MIFLSSEEAQSAHLRLLVGLPTPLHLERYAIIRAEVQIHPLHRLPTINMTVLSCPEAQSA